MKSSTKTQKQAMQRPIKSNVPKPEIRDNLDSRKNEEFEINGDNITHNKKDHHNKNKRSSAT